MEILDRTKKRRRLFLSRLELWSPDMDKDRIAGAAKQAKGAMKPRVP
jgi:hypothetical protein